MKRKKIKEQKSKKTKRKVQNHKKKEDKSIKKTQMNLTN